ncbi:MAG: pilus assembly protein PilP [Deltaproteobacteria bacterium]|nr:pilus assembly protein PilP [Deltaproteobacteria bacterium]MBW2205911.1 pilus assembly protein PilP [Deltaproteobacteria bacterium]
MIPLFLLCAGVVHAKQDVMFKDSRPMKGIFKTQQEASLPGTATPGDGQLAYFYNPTGKTDPFKSFIAEEEELESKKRRKPRTYLETLDLSQLQLIAIIVGPKGRYAMVREAKGVGHVIRKGTAIGRNGGVVQSITEQEVTIREEFKDFRGQSKSREIKKTLAARK